MPDNIATREKLPCLTGQRQNTKQIIMTAEKLNQKLNPNMLNGKNSTKQLSPNKIKLFAPKCLLDRNETVNRSNIIHDLSAGQSTPATAAYDKLLNHATNIPTYCTLF